MRGMFPKHQSLAAIMGIVMIGWAACYVFLVRPRNSEVSGQRAHLREMRVRLAKSGWPLQADQLDEALAALERRLDGGPGGVGVRGAAAAVIERSTRGFSAKIRESFGTKPNFMQGVSRLDYQEEFNRLHQKLSSQGIALAPDILKLAEDTSSPYTYQLVLHVWTLGLLTDLVRRHELTVATDPGQTVRVGGKNVEGALIEVLPVRAYRARAEDTRPYLLEFPVKITLMGTPASAAAFIRECVSEDCFLPVTRMQMYTDDPAENVYARDGKIVVDRVRMEIECSAFFSLEPPSDGAPGKRRPAASPGAALPQGA